METLLHLPPGNYPEHLLKEIKDGDRGWLSTFVNDSKPEVIAFLDIHNFTPGCEAVDNDGQRGSVLDFFPKYYDSSISRLKQNGAQINKVMGDGILASFQNERAACEGCMSVIHWWENEKPRFPTPFNGPDIKLIAHIAKLNVHHFRTGSRNDYLEISWFGAELNRFFKDSKDDAFSDGSDLSVWVSESAVTALVTSFPWIGRFDRARFTKDTQVRKLTIWSKRKRKPPTKNNYFGITLAAWKAKQISIPTSPSKKSSIPRKTTPTTKMRSKRKLKIS